MNNRELNHALGLIPAMVKKAKVLREDAEDLKAANAAQTVAKAKELEISAAQLAKWVDRE